MLKPFFLNIKKNPGASQLIHYIHQHQKYIIGKNFIFNPIKRTGPRCHQSTFITPSNSNFPDDEGSYPNKFKTLANDSLSGNNNVDSSKKKKKKFEIRLTLTQKYWLTICVLIGGAIGMFLFINNNQEKLSFFISPTELLVHRDLYPPDRRVRLGGLIKSGSMHHNPSSFLTTFILTDLVSEIEVEYKGLLPDLFAEGSGGVCEGFMIGPSKMKAVLCMAKHDEKYMPADLAQVINKNKKMLFQKQLKEKLATSPSKNTNNME